MTPLVVDIVCDLLEQGETVILAKGRRAMGRPFGRVQRIDTDLTITSITEGMLLPAADRQGVATQGRKGVTLTGTIRTALPRNCELFMDYETIEPLQLRRTEEGWILS